MINIMRHIHERLKLSVSEAAHVIARIGIVARLSSRVVSGIGCPTVSVKSVPPRRPIIV
jgi:hypothetical protein